MNSLEPGQRWVMRIRAWIMFAVLMIPGAIWEIVNRSVELIWPGAGIGGLVLLLIYPTFFAPDRSFRHLRWKVEDEELHLHKGWWNKVETIVPFRRVQHIDVSQGALERAFHVTSLMLHTAGTIDHKVVLPGLSRETAEQIRDEVRTVIVREADVR